MTTKVLYTLWRVTVDGNDVSHSNDLHAT